MAEDVYVHNPRVPPLLALSTNMRCLTVLAFVSSCVALSDFTSFRALGPQAANLWRLEVARRQHTETAQYYGGQIPLRVAPAPEFPEQWFTQPLDHFSNDTHTFEQRYWISTRHYRPRSDAPVIVLEGGETSGENRLPFLDTGIVDILTKATGGVGIVLEHRYVLSLAMVVTPTSTLDTMVCQLSVAIYS